MATKAKKKNASRCSCVLQDVLVDCLRPAELSGRLVVFVVLLLSVVVLVVPVCPPSQLSRGNLLRWLS